MEALVYPLMIVFVEFEDGETLCLNDGHWAYLDQFTVFEEAVDWFLNLFNF